MRAEERRQPLGQRQRAVRRLHGERENRADAFPAHAEPGEQCGDFRVDADQSIQPAQHESAQRCRRRRPPRGRPRISAGMERQHGLASRQQRAEQRQAQQPRRQIAAEMQVQNIRRQAPQQAHQRGRACRVIHAIGVLAPEARQVDGVAGVAVAPQVLADSHQIGLHAAVGRRIRPELHHPHSSLGRASSATGAPSRAEAIMARQPSVARAPS